MDTLNHNTEKQEFYRKENYFYCENYRCKNSGGFEEGLGSKKNTFYVFIEYKDSIVEEFVLEWEGGLTPLYWRVIKENNFLLKIIHFTSPK